MKRLTFNPHPSNIPIPLQHAFVNEIPMFGVFEVGFDDEATEIYPWLDGDDAVLWEFPSDAEVAEYFIGV